MATQFDSLESLLDSLARAAEMADRVSDNIEKSNDLSRKLSTEAAEKSSALLEETRKIAEAIDDVNLKKFLQSVTGIVGHLHQVAQEVAPADAENLSEPQKIFQQLSASFRSFINPLMENIDPEGKNKDKIALLGSMATLATRTLTVGSKMIGYSDKMDTNEKIHAVLGTVLMVAAVGILIAATVNPVTGPAVIGITLAAFALHAMGFHLAKKSIQRHVENDPAAQALDKDLDEVHNDAKTATKDFLQQNKVRRQMQFAADGPATELPTEAPAPAHPILDRIAHMFDFLKPR